MDIRMDLRNIIHMSLSFKRPYSLSMSLLQTGSGSENDCNLQSFSLPLECTPTVTINVKSQNKDDQILNQRWMILRPILFFPSYWLLYLFLHLLLLLFLFFFLLLLLRLFLRLLRLLLSSGLTKSLPSYVESVCFVFLPCFSFHFTRLFSSSFPTPPPPPPLSSSPSTPPFEQQPRRQ